MIISAYLLVVVFSLFMLIRTKSVVFAPLLIFTTAWSVSIASYGALGELYNPLRSETSLYLLFLLSFAYLATFAAMYFERRGNEWRPENISSGSLALWSIFSLVGSIGMFILTLFYFAGGSFDVLLQNTPLIRSARFQLTVEGAPILYSILEYAAYFYIGTTALAVLRPSSCSWWVLSIALVSSIIMCVAYASRTPLILMVLSLGFSGLLRIGIPRLLNIIRRPIIASALLSLWILGSIIAYQRDSGVNVSFNRVNELCGRCIRDSSVFSQSIVSNLLYSATSLANLNDIISENDTLRPRYGLATFAGVVSPLRKFGIDVPLNDQATDKGGFTNNYVFAYQAVYNTYSAFRDLRQDFGGFGSLIAFTLIFFACTASAVRIHDASVTRQYWIAMWLLWCAASPFTNAYSSLGKAILAGLLVTIFSKKITYLGRRR